MVTKQSVEDQLKKLSFPNSTWSWGQAEIRELPNVLLDDEKISDLVNGLYEGGFGLLVATNIRILLIDKKPLNFLTVEDLRFDMINEIDYSHRLIGAQISVSTGSKNLRFRSFNQQRLSKLIGHVQHAMGAGKQKQSDHQMDQNQHLEQINQQLQSYLLAQHKQQQELTEQLKTLAGGGHIPTPDPIKPDPKLSDYLFAQSLLAQHKANQPQPIELPESDVSVTESLPETEAVADLPAQTETLHSQAVREVYGQAKKQPKPIVFSFEINPLKIAYSKLPMALRNKKFGRPSFHAHSQSTY